MAASGLDPDFIAFSTRYEEAGKASGYPPICVVTELVLDLLENPSAVPQDNRLWPIHTFVRDALQRGIPLNWITLAKAMRLIHKAADSEKTHESPAQKVERKNAPSIEATRGGIFAVFLHDDDTNEP